MVSRGCVWSGVVLWVLLMTAATAAAQTVEVSERVEPRAATLGIPVSGHLVLPSGAARVGTWAVRVALFGSADDPTELWGEDHIVMTDDAGRFALTLGSLTRGGVPQALFLDAEALWIAVRVVGAEELPRAEVATAPYAVRALNAEALGGVQAADYIRNDQVINRVMAALRLLQREDRESRGGLYFSSYSSTTPDVLAKFLDSSGTIGDSAVIDVAGKVGIGTTTPASQFQVIASPGTYGIRSTTHGGQYAGWFRGDNGNESHGVKIQAGNAHTLGRPLLVNSYDDATTYLVVNGVGNVGVGTATPSSRLDIVAAPGQYGVQATSQSAQFAAWLRGDNGSQSYGLKIQAGNGSALGRPLVVASYDDATPLLQVDGAGDVGIGTATPAARLDVAGSGRFTGALTVAGATTLTGGVSGNLAVTGNVTATGAIAAKYQDVAEWVEAVEPLPPGTVVAADPDSVNRVRRSQRAYDPTVLGVVSVQPGVLLGEAGEGKVAVAQSGRVLVKVDARHGAIKPGDLLVASPTPGYAMLSRPAKNGMHRPGTIIGKALQGLAKGTGEILVLVTLQ